MTEFKIKFVYNGGHAEENRLDLYDGAQSLEGIARSLVITTHALINGRVRTHGDRAQGAEFYLHPSSRGSFIIEASVLLTGSVVSAGVFYGFIKKTFRDAVGLESEEEVPTTPLRDRLEPIQGEISAALEAPLMTAHRPILQNPEMTLAITRPRGETLVTFDSDTGNALRSTEHPLATPIIGHVTRYNTISRWGRLYDRSRRKVISFLLSAEATEREKSLITWSLHQANLQRDGTLSFHGTSTVSPSGAIKRYNLITVSEAP